MNNARRRSIIAVLLLTAVACQSAEKRKILIERITECGDGAVFSVRDDPEIAKGEPWLLPIIKFMYPQENIVIDTDEKANAHPEVETVDRVKIRGILSLVEFRRWAGKDVVKTLSAALAQKKDAKEIVASLSSELAMKEKSKRNRWERFQAALEARAGMRVDDNGVDCN